MAQRRRRRLCQGMDCFKARKLRKYFTFIHVESEANFDALKCENNVDGGEYEATNVFCIIESDSKSISRMFPTSGKLQSFSCARASPKAPSNLKLIETFPVAQLGCVT